jgi:predicted dehydrogenase
MVRMLQRKPSMNPLDRRDFLQLAGALGSATLGGAALTAHAQDIQHQVLAPAPVPPAVHKVRFAVIGLDHDHIVSMTAGVLRAGGELVAVLPTSRDALKDRQLADFRARFGNVRAAASEDEILQDRTIALVLAAPIPDQRAALGIRVMQAEKDYLSDKPGITTLTQLAAVRKAVRETGRKFAIMYSERLQVPSAVKAGELVHAGAIGKVVQTVNLAPHQTRVAERPGWFFDKRRYGGILTDIGSHQADQFLFYTGSTRARIVAAQTGNLAHPQYPQFEDFGDMLMSGNGATGYVRVDWFTPEGLGTWGDGRLFILGTEGYIELRKTIDPLGRKGTNHLLIVDRKEARHLDCSKLELPFSRQFLADIVNRTETAQSQQQALLAAELVLKAQKNASRPVSA